MRRLLSPSLCLVLLVATACDQVGRENGRVSAVPEVEPPRLTPVEVKPPRIDRSTVGRVKVIDPPRVDATQIDLLKQADGVVDILWVIDDSGSMVNERRRLVNNFNRFVQELVALRVDFQMGVISIVSNDGGRLRGMPAIITNRTSNPRAVFEANTTFPASRSRWEQGLRMAEFALTPPNTASPPNAGFIRASAALAVIVVTNEDDSSFGTTEYFGRTFRGLKGKGNENLISFSIIGGPVPNGCIPPGEAGLYGSLAEPSFRYTEVATRTGGIIGSICDASFEQTLIRIAQALNTLKRVFPMTLTPIVSSIRVTVVDGMVSTVIPQNDVTGWQYRADTNSVVFLGTYVPPPGSTIRIEYAFARP